jgi:hypothetical protein
MNSIPNFNRLSPSEQALALQRRRKSMQEFQARQQAQQEWNARQQQSSQTSAQTTNDALAFATSSPLAVEPEPALIPSQAPTATTTDVCALQENQANTEKPHGPSGNDPHEPKAGEAHEAAVVATEAQPTPAVPAATAANAPTHMTLETVFATYALSGLAGKIVRALAPHTEAEPAAILGQLLVAFGNVIGPGPHCMVGATRHPLNLFLVLVGESSKARKGTSWSYIARLFSEVDPLWFDTRVNSARLTANGLIAALRDHDQATDRRLLVLSEELASVLHTMARTRTQISPLLRSAWDSGVLRTIHHDRMLEATGTHISLIGHITQRELIQHFDRTETHNGFANRCLWLLVQRDACVPDGGNLRADELSALAQELRSAVDWARSKTGLRFQRDPAAARLWNRHYPTLSQAQPGLHTAATGRAEAQVLRLSAIYAALDQSELIRLPHLQAALAFWDRCAWNAGALFGTSTGDATADRIHEALQAASQGLSKRQITRLFRGRVNIDTINQSLAYLQSLGLAHASEVYGRGRSKTLWSLTGQSEAQPIQTEQTFAANQIVPT